MMMNTIKYNDILRTYQRIDLYRAKYRHSDFTPHAWCFHGNRQQGWNDRCSGGYLRFKNGVTSNGAIQIDASAYRYISFRFFTPGYTPKQLRYKLTINYINASGNYTKDIIVPYSGQTTTVFTEMSEATWAGTMFILAFIVSVESSPDVWTRLTNEVACEYIKVDKENVFANVLDANTITVVDFNEMRGDVETFAKQAIDWPGPDRVRQFTGSIKKTDIDEVNKRITTMSPYNGCATCDIYVCACYSTDYGHIQCQTCDGCYAFQACQACDRTCYTQARGCSCNQTCYQQPIAACTCNARCYGYSSCSCNNTCYSEDRDCGD